jgi:hypothetical protein
MSLEVYLLSISLARHRTIVPRPGRMGVSLPEPGVQALDHGRPGTMQSRAELPFSAGPIHRIERG